MISAQINTKPSACPTNSIQRLASSRATLAPSAMMGSSKMFQNYVTGSQRVYCGSNRSQNKIFAKSDQNLTNNTSHKNQLRFQNPSLQKQADQNIFGKTPQVNKPPLVGPLASGQNADLSKGIKPAQSSHFSQNQVQQQPTKSSFLPLNLFSNPQPLLQIYKTRSNNFKLQALSNKVAQNVNIGDIVDDKSFTIEQIKSIPKVYTVEELSTFMDQQFQESNPYPKSNINPETQLIMRRLNALEASNKRLTQRTQELEKIVELQQEQIESLSLKSQSSDENLNPEFNDDVQQDIEVIQNDLTQIHEVLEGQEKYNKKVNYELFYEFGFKKNRSKVAEMQQKLGGIL